MSKPPPPAPTASAIGPCPTVIKIVGRPGTGSLPSTIAPPDHPRLACKDTGTLLLRMRSELSCCVRKCVLERMFIAFFHHLSLKLLCLATPKNLLTETHGFWHCIRYTYVYVYCRLSLSRLWLSRITAYLEVKFWSLF